VGGGIIMPSNWTDMTAFTEIKIRYDSHTTNNKNTCTNLTES